MLHCERMKTIVVDLDRTLLHTDKSVSPYTIAVLKECKKRGMNVMVATARPLRDVMQYCRQFDFDALVVSNGARIICGTQRTEFKICQNRVERILEVLQKNPALRITLETGDCAYSNKPIAEYDTILSDDLVGVARQEGVVKILVHLDSAETQAVVQRELPEDLYATVSMGYLMQIMSKAATKWNGIKTMLGINHGLPAETIYFGDDHDDIEPLERCGIGVAVSNAIEEAKTAADYVAESNDADGVAKFLAQLLGEL